MADPLVQIRMQELALKQEDLQRKKEDDQGQELLEVAENAATCRNRCRSN